MFTNATYVLDILRPLIASRNALAVRPFRARSNNPDTFLSSLCAGASQPSRGKCEARIPRTVFLRYWPVGWTGTVAGLCAATRSSVTSTMSTGCDSTGGSCRWRK